MIYRTAELEGLGRWRPRRPRHLVAAARGLRSGGAGPGPVARGNPFRRARQLQGLGGWFSKAVKKLNPVNITRKVASVARAVGKSQIKMTQKAVRSQVNVARKLTSSQVLKKLNPINVARKIGESQLKFTKRMVDAEIKRNKKLWSSPTFRKVLLAVAIVAAIYFTGGAAVSYLMTIYAAMEKKKSGDAAAAAAAEQQQQMAEQGLRGEILASGYSPAQAEEVIARMRGGEDPSAALKSMGAPSAQAEGEQGAVDEQYTEYAGSEAAPISGDQAMQSREAFLQWFQGWKPEAVAALRAERPELFADLPSGGQALSGYDDNLGDWSADSYQLGDFDWGETLSSWGSAIAEAAPNILKTVGEAKTLQLQLARMRQGLAPLPTAQAVAQAQRLPAPPGSAGLSAGLSMPVVLGGAALLMGGMFLMMGRSGGGGGRSRRR